MNLNQFRVLGAALRLPDRFTTPDIVREAGVSAEVVRKTYQRYERFFRIVEATKPKVRSLTAAGRDELLQELKDNRSLLPPPPVARGPEGEPLGLTAAERVLSELVPTSDSEGRAALLREARSYLELAEQERELAIESASSFAVEVRLDAVRHMLGWVEVLHGAEELLMIRLSEANLSNISALAAALINAAKAQTFYREAPLRSVCAGLHDLFALRPRAPEETYRIAQALQGLAKEPAWCNVLGVTGAFWTPQEEAFLAICSAKEQPDVVRVAEYDRRVFAKQQIGGPVLRRLDRGRPVNLERWLRKGDYVFTSESVSEGHPDKICDRISDAIVDTYLAAEPGARCGVETLVTTNRVVLAGEAQGPLISAEQLIDVARAAIHQIGYEQDNLPWERAAIECHIHGQSTDIAQGVDSSNYKDEGAGDRGMIFGYACNEAPELMPAPIYYAHNILRELSAARHRGLTPVLGPDSKSQVTLEYVNGKPVRAAKVVVSIQHSDQIDNTQVREIIRPHVLKTLPEGWMCDEANFLVNPSGRFVVGGPDGDVGVTGRKIIVDTYGGAAPHGGGAFSGKDPTNVDRSAAYAARYLAKNVVAAGLAEHCTIQVAYAIGVAKPLSFYVDTAGADIDEDKLGRVLQELMDLSPRGIRTHLGLNKPIYTRTSSYGHFGRAPDADGGFSWERLDLVDELKRIF